MQALAWEDELTTTAHADWTEYVADLAEKFSREAIAEAADVNVSAVSRWITGETPRPKAEKVINMARGLSLDPVTALTHAGYLEQSDIQDQVVLMQSVSALSDEALVNELSDRLRQRLGDSAKTGPAGLPRLERKRQQVRVEETDERHQKRD